MARIVSLMLVAAFAGLVVGCGGKPDLTTAPTQPADPPPSPPVLPPISPKPTTSEPAVKPPPADDPGSVRGVIAHAGKAGQTMNVGYVELTAVDWVGDRVGLPVPKEGELGVQAESGTRPQVAVLKFDKTAASYEFPHLPKGTYLITARLEGGPSAWAKVEVTPGGNLTRDLKLDAGKGGTVEVTTPADFDGEVRLAPNDLIPTDDVNFVGGRIATQLELGVKAAKGKATVTDVPPGKYTVYAIPGLLIPRGTVEVTAGKTATVEIKTDKK
jgi:hypothetical protein